MAVFLPGSVPPVTARVFWHSVLPPGPSRDEIKMTEAPNKGRATGRLM